MKHWKLAQLFLAALVLFCGPLVASAGVSEDLLGAIELDSAVRVRDALAKGADPNLRTAEGETALILALHEEHYNSVRALLEAPGINLDAENSRGQTALMVAAFQGRIDIVRQLVDAHAEIHHTGWTALHYAAGNGQVEVLRYLIDEGAYVDAQSQSHTTPLMMAARAGQRAACAVLVDAGADPSPINDAGLSALDFAKKAGDEGLVHWFEGVEHRWQRRHEPGAPPEVEPGASPPASPPSGSAQ